MALGLDRIDKLGSDDRDCAYGGKNNACLSTVVYVNQVSFLQPAPQPQRAIVSLPPYEHARSLHSVPVELAHDLEGSQTADEPR
jgi:hypothetical protein